MPKSGSNLPQTIRTGSNHCASADRGGRTVPIGTRKKLTALSLTRQRLWDAFAILSGTVSGIRVVVVGSLRSSTTATFGTWRHSLPFARA